MSRHGEATLLASPVLPNRVPPDSCLQREAVKSGKTFLCDLWEAVVPPAEGVVVEM